MEFMKTSSEVRLVFTADEGFTLEAAALLKALFCTPPLVAEPTD